MKPHEETWRVWNDHGGVDQVALDGTRDVVLENPWPCVEQSDARVRLAAQAPAMARLLLFRMGDRHCEYCGRKVDRVMETDIQDPVYSGETLSLSNPVHHAPDCKLVTVLKAAGVL